MRETFPPRRQSVLLFARHLAERAGVPVREKHRVISEPRARREAAKPACRRPARRTPPRVRPARRGKARTRNAHGAGQARSLRARAVCPRPSPWRAGSSSLAPPNVPNRFRVPRLVASTVSPESSANAGSPDAVAAAAALMRAFSRKLVPVSSGSTRPSSAAETASIPYGTSNSRISCNLPVLWVAITRRPEIW